MGAGRAWTEEEEEYLAESYGTIPITEIIKKLNKNENAIRLRASKLGLTVKGECKRWELINKILNVVRKAKGLPLVSSSANPYKKNKIN